jgi:hypothetical protein
MRRQTSVFSLICTAWVVLSGAFGQQAQMSAASDEVADAPGAGEADSANRTNGEAVA